MRPQSTPTRYCAACACMLTGWHRYRAYCSRTCYEQALTAHARVSRVCIVCGASFWVQRSKAQRFSTCSPACRAVRMHAQAIKNQPIAAMRSGQVTTARATAQRPIVACGCGCGATFQVKPSRLAQRINGRVFLTRAHYEAWFWGTNTTNWQGGHRPDYGPNWKAQRALARARDRVCQTCQSTHPLVVHHIRFFVDCADYHEANRLENLVTLCRTCHMRLHGRLRSALEKPGACNTLRLSSTLRGER